MFFLTPAITAITWPSTDNSDGQANRILRKAHISAVLDDRDGGANLPGADEVLNLHGKCKRLTRSDGQPREFVIFL